MGKNDYQKSFSRQMESIVVAVCTIYGLVDIILGYTQGWNLWGQVAVLFSIMTTWIYFFGRYGTYEVRAHVTSATMQVIIIVYGYAVGDFYSVLSVFVSLCIMLGLYGVPKAMIYPFVAYTGLIYYFSMIHKSLVWGSYSSDLGMLTRICQGYLVLFAVTFLVYRYKKSESSMLEMIDALRKSERQKDDFLANVSHEIRTPINTICGISELMLKKGMPADMKEDMLNIQSAGRNLMMVVSDILDYSELQEGDFELVEENYYISSTIYDVINMTMAKKSEKNLELIVDCDPNMPSVLIGDEQKIRRVIMNLVNNAVEFTNEGCVSIHFGCRREEYGINLIVSVRDTGIGMSQENIEKLFLKFSQADMGRTRKKGGVGLGLAIAQAIVNKMGGFITVNSAIGKGSEFKFAIPQKVYDDKPLAVIPNKMDMNAAVYINMEQFVHPGVREEYSKAIRHIVEQSGVSCRVFRNLVEIKRWTKRESYNQVFISLKEYQEDPVFFDNLSMQTNVSLILDRYDDAKVQNKLIGKIYKPFSILSIVSAVENQLANEQENHRIDDKHQLYIPDVNILVIDDNRMNIRVVEGLLGEYGVNVSYALSGQEGIDKLESKAYDLVFLDHMMPEMDGVETLHKIRRKQNTYFKNVPIIALTANAIAGTREMLIKEGFDDFVPKPVESSVLQRALKRHIPEERQKYVEDYRSEEEPREIVAVEEIVNPQTIENKDSLLSKPIQEKTNELVIGDLDTDKGIMYCGNKNNYIAILKSHREGADESIEQLEKLYREEDWKNYTIVIHGIKSSMMSVGAVHLSEMAKALELAGKGEDYDYIHREHNNMIIEFRRVRDMLYQSPVLGVKESVQLVSAKPQIEDDQFDKILAEMENTMYEFDGDKMKALLDRLSEYSYSGRDLHTELAQVYKKVEMSDFMSAYDTVTKLKDKLKKA